MIIDREMKFEMLKLRAPTDEESAAMDAFCKKHYGGSATMRVCQGIVDEMAPKIAKIDGALLAQLSNSG